MTTSHGRILSVYTFWQISLDLFLTIPLTEVLASPLDFYHALKTF